MSKAEEIAKAIYIRCFDDDFKYPDVLNALRICAEENAETIEQLQAQIEKMKQDLDSARENANRQEQWEIYSVLNGIYNDNFEVITGVSN